jgi:hypothetical protein
MFLPLAEIAELLRQGVSQLLHKAEKRLLLKIMEDEVAWLTGERYSRQPTRTLRRWGIARGSVVIHGPRIRRRQREAKLGSYALFRQEEVLQRQVWNRIMRGLTMHGYGPAVLECATAFGLEKSAVSGRFIQASAQRVHELLHRDLHGVQLRVLVLDGVELREEHMLTALGINRMDRKMILGLYQGASENRKVCEALLADLGQAYDRRDLSAAQKLLEKIPRELSEVNPSAARRLEEGLEEMLTLRRLNVPRNCAGPCGAPIPWSLSFYLSCRLPKCEALKTWTSDGAVSWLGLGLGRATVPSRCRLSRSASVPEHPRRSRKSIADGNECSSTYRSLGEPSNFNKETDTPNPRQDP